MKALLLLLGISMLLSNCDLIDPSPPTGFYPKELVLSNYEEEGFLGKLNIYVPSRYDTLLHWVDLSDCGCCGSKKYRLLNKSSCLIQESGFFHLKVCRDTFDRLSIVYQCKEEENILQEVDSTFLRIIANNIERRIQLVWPGEPIKWKAKKITHIDRQPYLFLHFISKNIYSQGPVEQIYAGTFFNKTLILFIYENNQRDRSEFKKEAYTSIQSIRLNPI